MYMMFPNPKSYSMRSNRSESLTLAHTLSRPKNKPFTVILYYTVSIYIDTVNCRYTRVWVTRIWVNMIKVNFPPNFGYARFHLTTRVKILKLARGASMEQPAGCRERTGITRHANIPQGVSLRCIVVVELHTYGQHAKVPSWSPA